MPPAKRPIRVAMRRLPSPGYWNSAPSPTVRRVRLQRLPTPSQSITPAIPKPKLAIAPRNAIRDLRGAAWIDEARSRTSARGRPICRCVQGRWWAGRKHQERHPLRDASRPRWTMKYGCPCLSPPRRLARVLLFFNFSSSVHVVFSGLPQVRATSHPQCCQASRRSIRRKVSPARLSHDLAGT